MLRFTCSLRTSSTRRIGREVVFLPWNARPWPAYDTHADDWKFLDRALSAVVEMTPEEVSERSLRLCPRHLLHEIEDPVEALQRRCRIEARRSLRQQQQQQQQQRGKKQPQRQGEEQRAAQQLLEQERYMEEGLCHTTAPESERESQQTAMAQVHEKKKRSSKRNVNIHNSGGGSVNGNNNNNNNNSGGGGGGGGGGGSLVSASASGRTETVTAGGEAALCLKRTSRANGKDGKRNSKSDASGRDEMQLPKRPLPDDNILNV